jgi:hypothetical protein
MSHLKSFLGKKCCQIFQHLEDIQLQKRLALQRQSPAKEEEAWLLVELY